jgi:predicted Zn-dependent peptidase
LILRIAACVLAAFAFGTQAARAASSPVLTRAGSATIIAQDDEAAPLVHVTVVVRAGLDRQTLSQNGLAALAAQTILRTPVAGGSALSDAIAAQGGNVHFTVDPSDVRFAVEAIPAQAPAVLALFTQALTAPSFAPATVAAARTDLQTKIAENAQGALQVGIEMLGSAVQGPANAGMPSLGLPQIVAQTTPADLRAFYGAYYRRGGAYVSAVGRLSALPAGTLDGLATALPDGSTSAVAATLPKLEGQSRELIAHRAISAPWLVAQYSAPAVDSKDFGAMLVLASFMQRTLADIAQVPDVVSPTYVSRAVGSLYRYDRTQPSLVLFVNGSVGQPDRTFATALSIAGILAETKLRGSIDSFKAMALGDFVNGSTSLEARAWLAVVFAQDGGSPDYVARVTEAIGTTNAADLQRVARDYLNNPTIALVLPRGT